MTSDPSPRLRHQEPATSEPTHQQPLSLATFLRSSLALRAGLAFAMLVLLLVGFNHQQHLQRQHRQAAQSLQVQVDTLARTAEGKYTERRRSLMFLANTPPIKGLVRARLAGGVDPEGGSTEAQWHLRMKQIFSAYLTSTPEAYQVGFIGAANNGLELVRVERRGAQVQVLPATDMKHVGDAVYYREAARLGEGQVFVSDVSLHREQGQVELPHRPTIRYATPVYTDADQVFGVIVISIDLRGRLGALLAGSDPQVQVYATNAEGDFLVHPDPSLGFGFAWDSAIDGPTASSRHRPPTATRMTASAGGRVPRVGSWPRRPA